MSGGGLYLGAMPALLCKLHFAVLHRAHSPFGAMPAGPIWSYPPTFLHGVAKAPGISFLNVFTAVGGFSGEGSSPIRGVCCPGCCSAMDSAGLFSVSPLHIGLQQTTCAAMLQGLTSLAASLKGPAAMPAPCTPLQLSTLQPQSCYCVSLLLACWLLCCAFCATTACLASCAEIPI